MNTYRTLLDDELGDVPPSTVDVERTIVRQRRRQRGTRIVTTVSALGLAVLAVAAFAQLPGRVGASGEGFGAPVWSPSASPSASPSPDPSPSSSWTPDVATAARLTTALATALDGKIPGATYVPNRTREPENIGALVFNHRVRAPEPNRFGENYFFATGDVRYAAGRGGISVMIGREDRDLFSLQRACDEGPLDARSWSCDDSVGPAGETIVEIKQGGTKAIAYTVIVVRADGVGLNIRVVNYAEAEATAEFDGDRRDADLPPLTQQQIRALALDPALTP